jgi:hypothetical protein
MLNGLRLFFLWLTLPPVIVAVLLFFAIDKQPIVSHYPPLNQHNIARAKRILDFSGNSQKPVHTIDLSRTDLNIAINFLLNHLIKSASSVHLSDNAMHFQISLLLPPNLFGRVINIRFSLQQHHGFPTIGQLHIGRIAIADEFAGEIIESIIKYTDLKQYYMLAVQHIRAIEIRPEKLTITYLTRFKTPPPSHDQTAQANDSSLIFYQQIINRIVSRHNPRWRLSLADLLQPLFLAAYQRSTLENAIEENRALLLATSSYVNKNELRNFIPIQLSTEKYYPVYLFRRVDLAKHFTGSAALAATGATALSEMLGQDKELADLNTSSGFSFTDLAADRAGVKLGSTATASPEMARKIQKAMHNIKDYRAFMPDIKHLPENLTRFEFKARFGSVDSPRYRAMIQIIDNRINALPIYQ